jgi:hypothetical protein
MHTHTSFAQTYRPQRSSHVRICRERNSVRAWCMGLACLLYWKQWHFGACMVTKASCSEVRARHGDIAS